MDENKEMNAIENILKQDENEADINLDELDELEAQLEDTLASQLSDIEFLEKEKAQIKNPDALGEVIKQSVWEQFLAQIGVDAGEEFINDNNGLTLDLSKDAHIQTAENFEKGKIATHNTKIDYQQRHDDWQSNFQKDPNIPHGTKNFRYNKERDVLEKRDTRSGSWKKVLNKDARSDFDKGRAKGSSTANTNMDHTISASEIIRDPEAAAYMTREEQITFANSDKNLNLMDSAANQSKGDSTMSEFLDSERNGKKAAERFNIDEQVCRKKDAEARKEYAKQKKEAEKRGIAAGKESRKQEAKRMAGKSLQAVVQMLFFRLLGKIIGELVKWFKKEKSFKTFLESMKSVIRSFFEEWKQLLGDAVKVIIDSIMTAIVGPIVRLIKKVWIILKQGWESIKEVAKYLKDPANENVPMKLKLLKILELIMPGLVVAGSFVLSEVIEKCLIDLVPALETPIPLLGSPANLIGMFLGAITAGVIGAIAINLIDKAIARKQEEMYQKSLIEKGNKTMQTQRLLLHVRSEKTEKTIRDTTASIRERHKQASVTIQESMSKIFAEEQENKAEQAPLTGKHAEDLAEMDDASKKMNQELDDLDADLDALLNW